MKITPIELREVFFKIQAANIDVVVVGGQAVNLWAYNYYSKCPELPDFLPFASEDLDFYGGRVEVLLCKDVLQGRAAIAKDFDPTPNAGIVLIDLPDKTLRIDFLSTVYGLNDSEITDSAITFIGGNELKDINIKVLHPLLCLEGKLKCLRGLPQSERQDLKHVKMSLICLQEFLKDCCQSMSSRSGLKLVERVLQNALREDGLSAWYRHGIANESAIPIDTIINLDDEKWQRFYKIRFPLFREQIDIKRERYLQAINRMN